MVGIFAAKQWRSWGQITGGGRGTEKKVNIQSDFFFNFLYSTNFELLIQIKEKSIKRCECLEFLIYVWSGRYFTISGRPKINPRHCCEVYLPKSSHLTYTVPFVFLAFRIKYLLFPHAALIDVFVMETHSIPCEV